MFFAFRGFSIIFVLIFGIVLFGIVTQIASSVKQWSTNNNSPILDVFVTVISKRQNISRGPVDNNGISNSSTTYYVTFQVESGDRMEFRVSGSQYGMIMEGDMGMLKFQGTRFLEFRRG